MNCPRARWPFRAHRWECLTWRWTYRCLRCGAIRDDCTNRVYMPNGNEVSDA